MLLGVVFSVRDGPRGHENKYIEVILKHCSAILAISNFDVFLVYDVTLRHSYSSQFCFPTDAMHYS